MSVTDTRFDQDGNPVLLGAYAPPRRIIQAIESGIVDVTRRVEIYESDGTTLWQPGADAQNRLIDGSVSVDYSSDERRKIDLTLDNTDNVLHPNSNNGFWYDKILKVYRGVKVRSASVDSPVVIVESANPDRLQYQLGSVGLKGVDIFTDVVSPAQIPDYDYYVAESGTALTARSALLVRQWNSGKNVITIGTANTQAEIPLISTTLAGTVSWGVSVVTGDTPTAGSFANQQTTGSAVGARATALVAGVIALAVWPAGTPTHTTAAMGFSPSGGVWLDIHLPDLTSVESRNLVRAAVKFMESRLNADGWETQLGEFMIDNFAADNFPHTIKVTGRDYTKKLMGSKLKFNSTFAVGTPLDDFIVALAANAGVPHNKMRIDVGPETLNSEMSYDRGTTRWSIIKDAATGYDYEVFFDAFGYFTVRPFYDPSTSPVSWSFNTGNDGNLVKFSRSSNDSRVYNHVYVYGDPADGSSNILPYFGEAEITDATSPVHSSRIGDRVMEPLVTTFLSSNAEAQALAEKRLRVAALESYDLNLESLYYPWLETGEIVNITDPLALESEPSKFLLDTLSYPLGLGSMSATGKRVTFVGSPGGTLT